jgi:lipopolysaccharide export system permease protein
VFRILERSIFGELCKVFIPSLIGITGLIVMATVVKELSDQGLSILQILGIVALIIPSMMPFIIPPTTLFAACVVFGRLSHDNEITAIKSAGISVTRVIRPGAVLGLAMSGLLFGLYYYVIPASHHLVRTVVTNDAEQFILATLKKDHEVRGLDRHLNWDISVEQVHGRQLRNAVFKRKSEPKGRYDVIARARDAEIHVDMASRQVIVSMRHGEVLDEAGKTHFHFEEKDYTADLPEIEKKKPSTREMTWNQLLAEREDVGEKLRELEEELAKVKGDQSAAAAQKRPYLEYHRMEYQHQLLLANAELQQRPALACGCFFFVMIGCPVGIWFSRSDYLSAFISCFLPIVVVYYPLYLCFSNFAKSGKINIVAGHWMANVALALAALALFRKLMKN